jgi:hypothetical protein
MMSQKPVFFVGIMSIVAAVLIAFSSSELQSQPSASALEMITLAHSPAGNSCSAPANGSCASCSVSCPATMIAACRPGVEESLGNPFTGARNCLHQSQCVCKAVAPRNAPAPKR